MATTRPLTLLAFAISLALGGLALLIFVEGIIRDTSDPRMRVDLSRPSEATALIRLWGAGQYTLHLTTVNHAPTDVGARFAGEIEVELLEPSGAAFFGRAFPEGSLDHVKPTNMHWTTLASFPIDAWPLQRWTLRARVVKPDPRWAGAFSEITLKKRRQDVGMGGMVNYVMTVPAIAFISVALVIASVTAARGGRKLLLVMAAIPTLVLLWLLTVAR